MSETEKHPCAQRVWGDYSDYPCMRQGTLYEEDKWWCWQHAPSKIKARRAASDKASREKSERQRARWTREAIALKFHPRLVEMLTKPLQDAACVSFVGDLRTLAAMLELYELDESAKLLCERADEIEALLAEIREASHAS